MAARHYKRSENFREPGQHSPRRFGISTLLFFTAAYAVMFGLLRGWGMPPVAFVTVCVFVTAIGASQIWLFGGKKPILASALTGAFLLSVGWAIVVPAADGVVVIMIVGAYVGFLSGSVVLFVRHVAARFTYKDEENDPR